AGNGPGDIVGDGGGADAALGSQDRDDASDCLGFRGREQVADRTYDVDGADRGDDIVADAAAHQLAVERHVVDAADHNDPGAGVAGGCELVEVDENVGAGVGFQHDDVRGRSRAIGLDGGRHAAHLDLQMRLAEAAVVAGRLHGCSGFHRLAE